MEENAPTDDSFATTRWSLIAAAAATGSATQQLAAAEALQELAKLYWYPLYAYIRRRGFSPHDAEDRTQGFFVLFIEKSFVKTVDPNRGRFRSFLLTALARYLSNQRDFDNAVKRGGGRAPLQIDAQSAEQRYLAEPVDNVTPEILFERRWASELLDHVLRKLRARYAREHKVELFDSLCVMLSGEDQQSSYPQLAERLKLTPDAVKSAAYRLRQAYRELLREEIARTVGSPEEVDEEIKLLFQALAH